jgi:hypothetical protein
MRRFNTAITRASLAIGMIAGGLLMAPAAHAQRYLVNGHPATAKEEQLLRSHGFTAGAWVMNGRGISLDVEHVGGLMGFLEAQRSARQPVQIGDDRSADRLSAPIASTAPADGGRRKIRLPSQRLNRCSPRDEHSRGSLP